MSWTVDIQTVAARKLAVAHGSGRPEELVKHLMPAFDRVYTHLKPQGLKLGHNVALYYGVKNGEIAFEAGVEVFGEFEPGDGVVAGETPAGRVAHIHHVGPYSKLGQVAGAMNDWAAANGHPSPLLPQWEVYGDWVEDETRLQTDVYALLERT